MQIDYSQFTEKARTSITDAYRMTLSCQYAAIEPQVMMVSLVSEGKDMVFFLLEKMGVDRTAFCQAISDSMSSLPHAENQQPPISSDLEKILMKAQSLAHESGSAVVAMEHIFWAFSVVDGPVKDVMGRFGITPQKASRAVSEFRGGNMAQQETHGEEEPQQGSTRSSLRALKKYASNLSVLAEEGKIEPVIGRDDEVRRILQILSRKTKNNPMLVGAPGTGKTAIIEGLAHRIIRGDVPRELSGLKIYSLDISALVAGTSQHGEFEERLKKVVADAKSDPNIVLFIDEIHLLIGAGGAMNAANILKPELARGEIKVIGATTIDECTKYIESDKAFERRFQKVFVEEPDTDSAIAIMRGVKQRFETFHRIKILDEAVVSAVRLSQRYITDRFLPDKAIDLVDEAASRMRIERSSVPQELDSLSAQIRCKEMERESLRQDEQNHDLSGLDTEIANLREKENELNAKWQNERSRIEQLQAKRDESARLKTNSEQAQLSGNYEEAVSMRAQMDAVNAEIDALVEEMSAEGSPLLKTSLDEDDIRSVVTAWTGIPVNKLDEDETEKLSNLEDILKRSVIGQDAGVAAVSKVIRRNKMGFGDAGRPIGSFLFLGTTGVGKTELAKTLAEFLFNSRDMLVRIDMSEYQQEFSVSRLFGAPPGYVGYDQGGQLTEAVRRKPYSVILLDEIEKAHPKVFETLLQVLDDGRMTDGQGRVVDFKNTIIIMTSNMGASAITQALVGAEVSAETVDSAKAQVLGMMKERVAPEFINRIDDIVMFMPLGLEQIAGIVAIQVARLQRRMLSNGMDIRVDENALVYLTQMSYQPEYGARPVKRAINDYLVNEITMKLLSREITRELPVLVGAAEGHLSIQNETSN